jgi:serine/threonine protein kinase
LISTEPIARFYQLENDEVLGKGSHDPVVICIRISDGREFAAKVVKRDADSMREVALMRPLDHPNILRLVDAFERRQPGSGGGGGGGGGDGESSELTLVLELARGGDLFDEVQRRGGKLAEPDAASYMAQVCVRV